MHCDVHNHIAVFLQQLIDDRLTAEPNSCCGGDNRFCLKTVLKHCRYCTLCWSIGGVLSRMFALCKPVAFVFVDLMHAMYKSLSHLQVLSLQVYRHCTSDVNFDYLCCLPKPSLPHRSCKPMMSSTYYYYYYHHYYYSYHYYYYHILLPAKLVRLRLVLCPYHVALAWKTTLAPTECLSDRWSAQHSFAVHSSRLCLLTP